MLLLPSNVLYNDYAIYSQKKFFTFPKGSKILYVFLMRSRRHRNMRFGNSERYHYKNIQTTRFVNQEKKSPASFTPWPDVSKRFITKQTKESEKLATKHPCSNNESCLLFTTKFFNPFLINLMDFSQ